MSFEIYIQLNDTIQNSAGGFLGILSRTFSGDWPHVSLMTKIVCMIIYVILFCVVLHSIVTICWMFN